MLFAVDTQLIKDAPKLREALVEPHIARLSACHQVARPHVRQLVGQVFLITGISADDAGGQGDIVGMLHAALARADVADAVEGIRADALFEERDNLMDMDESGFHPTAQARDGVDLDRDVAFDAVIHILP